MPQGLPSTTQQTLSSIDLESYSHKPTAETLAALDVMTGSRKKKKPAKTSDTDETHQLAEAELMDPQARLQVVQAS